MIPQHAADTEYETRIFARVVILNETAKELIARSFRVNLLALDAMVQSKRGGNSLRGFDEVSSQMRSWSRDLHQELERLGELSQKVVAEASTHCKEAHLLRLLDAAAAQSKNAAAEAALTLHRAEQLVRESEMRRTWRLVRDAVGDLNQLGLMAVVLSRAAMIEASGGSPEQRAQLSDVSQEFYRNAEAVVNALKGLLKVASEG